jgi:outer membrane protein OmpA-like peptidoglycan-associated protein
MTPGSAFCNNCGTPVTPAASQPQPPAQIPPVVIPPVVVPPVAPPVIPPAAPPNVETGWTTVPAAPTPVEQPQVPVTPSPVAPIQSAVAPANVPPPAGPVKTNQGKGCITALIVTLVIIVLIVLAVIGGMIYVAHKVKNKVQEFATKESQHIHDSLSDSSTKTTVDMSDVPGSFPPRQPLVQACPDAPAATATDTSTAKAIIPLREGLTWVNAWRRFNGDVEIVYKVGAVAPNYVDTSNSGMGFNNSQAVKGHQVDTRRIVCRTDLQNASTYVTLNDARLPDIIPQTTSFSMSQKSFQELKSNGKFTITYGDFTQAGGRMVPVPQTAELSRVEPDDVNYPVILNGQPTNLPVIHAKGHFHFSGDDKVKKLYTDPSFFDEDGEVFVLDDVANPVTLLWAMGPVFQVRVVSITYPVDKPQIEQQLAKEKKAVIYGIYFDFNQATIKKESQPVLKEIADAMKNNPDWVLTVNGYTDNIGGDTYNLDLSKKRSAAVKNALVVQFGIAPTRLTTGGFGASGFVDTNETLEGRARNRRVELIRQ